MTVAAGGTCATNGTTATILLALADPDTDPAALAVTTVSSDPALLPADALTTTGTGATRTSPPPPTRPFRAGPR